MAEYGICTLGGDTPREINGLTASECEKIGGEFRGGPDTVDSLVRDVAAWKAAGHPAAEIRFRATRKYGAELYAKYLESYADYAESNVHGHKSQRKGVPTSGVRAASAGIPPRASVKMNPVVEDVLRRRGLLD